MQHLSFPWNCVSGSLGLGSWRGPGSLPVPLLGIPEGLVTCPQSLPLPAHPSARVGAGRAFPAFCLPMGHKGGTCARQGSLASSAAPAQQQL